MSPRTERNLNTAMQIEAFTHAEYLRFAARARMNENPDIARLFQDAADADRTDHFTKEAEIAGLVANDSENLKHAIKRKAERSCKVPAIRERSDCGWRFHCSGALRKNADSRSHLERQFQRRFSNRGSLNRR